MPLKMSVPLSVTIEGRRSALAFALREARRLRSIFEIELRHGSFSDARAAKRAWKVSEEIVANWRVLQVAA